MYKLIVLFLIVAFVHLDGFTQDIYDACRKGNVELIKQLSKVNPDTINTPNKSGYTPLLIAGYRNQLDAVKVLLDLGANVNAVSEDGTVLTAACYKSNTALVKILLEQHADVNVKNNAGTTPLMFAIMAENEEIVKLLMENKADTQTMDNSRKSAVDFAKDCDSKVIKQLIIK
jgi:ankyrin repeat protein